MQYRLKSFKTFPPGGWQFKQRETHWGLPPGLNFSQAVAKIIEHRRANALGAKHKVSIDPAKVAKELEEFTIVRIGFNSGFVYPLDGEKKNPLSWSVESWVKSLKQKGVLLVEKLKNSAAGLRVMREWWGDGGLPVEQEKAESRAAICETCPNNIKTGWWGKLTKPIASKIKEHMQVKSKLEISVPSEDKLGICSACDCPLVLKVHSPIAYIAENTTPEVLEKLAPQCWILAETQIK